MDALWARAAVGILGGAPKCCKSWLALELCVAVATRTRCLNRFTVEDPGSVMLYMAEDSAPVIKTRLQGLCSHHGVSFDNAPIDVITAPSVRIDRERDQDRLTRTVRRGAPRLLVLIPFVRLHRVDENDAGQVSAVLGYLRALQRDSRRGRARRPPRPQERRRRRPGGPEPPWLRKSHAGATPTCICAGNKAPSPSPSSIVPPLLPSPLR